MTTPQIQDFTTGAERALHVEVSHGVVYELLLRLFVATADPQDSTFDMHDELQRRIAESSTTLQRDLAALERSSEVWLGLLSLAYKSGFTADIDAFLAHLGELTPQALRRHLLDFAWIKDADQVDPDLLADAAAGDAAAVATLAENELAKDKHAGLRYVLAMDPARSQSTLIDVLRHFTAEVFDEREELAELLALDAEEKATLATSMEATELVERATNGVTVDISPDLEGVILVPSASVSPWVIISAVNGKHVFCYSISQSLTEGDADAPPPWLVDYYKALGDEKRLRILGILAEGPTSLTELAQRIEVAKSTVHHHLGLLRAAGLIRVTLGRDKAYSLRNDVVPQASCFLESYIRPRTKESS